MNENIKFSKGEINLKAENKKRRDPFKGVTFSGKPVSKSEYIEAYESYVSRCLSKDFVKYEDINKEKKKDANYRTYKSENSKHLITAVCDESKMMLNIIDLQGVTSYQLNRQPSEDYHRFQQ